MHIDSYSFGSITVDGKVHRADLIIFPERIISHWWRIEDHALAAEDLEDVINYKPQLLIVGTGASGRMEIPLSTKSELQKNQIELIEGDTYKASQLFNVETKKKRKVVGAFHLTC